MARRLKFWQALREAIDLCMARDETVHVFGLGVPDPKAVFGTTAGLRDKYGADRVTDMPTSESGMTGAAIGSALVGNRPIMVHHRMEFALLAIEQIVNQAAKWHYMFAGKLQVPLVVRMIVGRGWGQGPQHSQSLHAWFAHVPGLKVVMPCTAYDVKGLFISSVEDNNPVIFIEHRWLYELSDEVPEGLYRVPIGEARICREGTDLTIVSMSYMTVEALKAAAILADNGVTAEVIDLRSLRPWDAGRVTMSVLKTGRLVVVDSGWKVGGFGAEVVAEVVEHGADALKCPPRRIGLPDCPTPTTPGLANHYYPLAVDIAAVALEMLGKRTEAVRAYGRSSVPLDVPDRSFTGPF